MWKNSGVAAQLRSLRRVACGVAGLTPKKDCEMDLVQIILTVCTLAMPEQCEDRKITIEWSGTLTRCVMDAPPYIAEWIDVHANLRAERWRCVYHGNEDERV